MVQIIFVCWRIGDIELIVLGVVGVEIGDVVGVIVRLSAGSVFAEVFMWPCIVGVRGDSWDRSESFNWDGSHHVGDVVVIGGVVGVIVRLSDVGDGIDGLVGVRYDGSEYDVGFLLLARTYI